MVPKEEPSDEPGEEPSDEPGEEPSDEPGEEPSDEPGEEPSDEPGEEPSDEPTVTTTAIDDYIYFDNSYTKWDEVYAYWWESGYGRTYDFEDNDYGWVADVDADGNPANHPVTFPGTKMTQVPGTDVWQARIPFGAQKIIFSSGKSDDQIHAGEIGYQTADLDIDTEANAGQIYVVEVGSEAKKGKGIEKTKYKYSKGEWVDYTGEYVPEEIKGEPSDKPSDEPSDNEPGTQPGGEQSGTPTPTDNPVKTGDSAMPIAFAVVAMAALGTALVLSKKKSSER